MDCPKCNGKLQTTTITIEEMNKHKAFQGAGVQYDLELNQCFVCGGVWFDKGELDAYLRKQITLVQSPSIGAELDAKLNQKKGKCPACQVEMQQQPYPLDKSVQVDICSQCSGVWLDSTEIDRLEKDEWKVSPATTWLSRLRHFLSSARGS